jgi:hypothetical protein
LLYYLAAETGSGDRTEAQQTLKGWMDTLKKEGKVDLGEAVRNVGSRDFLAERVSDQEVSQCFLGSLLIRIDSGPDQGILHERILRFICR